MASDCDEEIHRETERKGAGQHQGEEEREPEGEKRGARLTTSKRNNPETELYMEKKRVPGLSE